MIKLSAVTVRRGPNRIVQGLQLILEPGRVFWVIGPNGAGKTSLLRVIAGIDQPQTGSVTRAAPDDEPVLYFQSEMSLPPAARVRDWDRAVGRLLPAETRRRKTPLWPHVDSSRKVARLSTGERKRLVLDPILRRPGPMLLDEPFEHLSPDAKGDLRALLEERARERVVVVATNQGTQRAAEDGGLRLEAGTATPLAAAGRTV